MTGHTVLIEGVPFTDGTAGLQINCLECQEEIAFFEDPAAQALADVVALASGHGR